MKRLNQGIIRNMKAGRDVELGDESMFTMDEELFLKKCEKFHVIENRHWAFPLAFWLCEEDPVAGISFLLSTWNARWSGRREFFGKLPEQVKQALDESKDDLNKLNQQMLEEVNWDKNKNEIIRVFEFFEKQPAIKTTGASKALHLLKPNLFVMWDGKIRKKYQVRTYSFKANGAKYLEFMKKMSRNYKKYSGTCMQRETVKLSSGKAKSNNEAVLSDVRLLGEFTQNVR